jgi:alpha-1,2-mannosyltransferase
MPVLTADRVRAAGDVWCVAIAAGLAALFWLKPDMQVGRDFGVMWIAGRMAWQGQIAELYGAAMPEAVAAAFGPAEAGTFYYPPVGLLLFVPFGFLSFPAAAMAWVALTGTAFATAVGRIAGWRGVPAALAFPAAIICALYGQNGLLLAALLGLAAVTLDRYPVVAGVAIGCLAYKPHVAVLAPLILVLTWRWRAFLAAGGTTLLLIGASVLAFGIRSWTAFVADLPAAEALYATGVPGFAKFASPYAAARLLGASAGTGWTVQALCAAGAIGFLVWAARRCRDGTAAIAAMTAATGFCVPFLGEYDLPILAIPGAWLIASAEREGWLPLERLSVIALYIAPFVVTVLAPRGVPLAPLAMGLLMLCVGRRLSGIGAPAPV